MIGVGQRRQTPSDDEAAKAAALWGNNPVHPTAAAYRCMADCLMTDIQNEEAKYTNPSKPTGDSKRPKIDLSQGRDNRVTGCSAAAPRRDIRDSSGSSVPGQRHQNIGTSHRGSARGSRSRGSVASYRGSRGGSRGGYGRRVWGRGRWGSF